VTRYFLQLSYNGKNYHGWQVQKNAHSVQAELNTALNTFMQRDVETLGCGRTDTGVHAEIFFAHFDAEEEIAELESFVHHINCLLPKDIAVQKIIPVHEKAHARYDATSRTYRYFIHHHKNPFLDEWSFRFPYELDMERMNNAANILFDYTDFSCFSKSRTQVKTNICKIISAKWRSVAPSLTPIVKGAHPAHTPTLKGNSAHTPPLKGDHNEQIVFEISADRFLRNMVRAIVGTMLDIGEKKIDVNDFRKIIEGKSRQHAGVSVPAHALYLTNVTYPFKV
jgi:tRNA pseudouridine38-40 synthase